MSTEKEIIEQCMAWLHARALSSDRDAASLDKAGIIPIHQGECLLMKPVARHKDLAPPPWQIAKGTRMMQTENGAWVDVGDGAMTERLEPLACTALREGIEEVGLTLENILTLAEIGTHGFASARSGKPKQMHVFACEVKSKTAFLSKAAISAATAETGWFPLDDLPDDIRTDHAEILRAITNLSI